MPNPVSPARSDTQALVSGTTSGAELRQMLETVRALDVSDLANENQIKEALTAIAHWNKSERDERLGGDWIRWIDDSLIHIGDSRRDLYGRFLRRIRTLCRRTSSLPESTTIEESEIEVDWLKDQVAGTQISDIFRGNHRGRLVALKSLRVTSPEDLPECDKSARTEAIIWKWLKHANIVPFLGVLVSSSRVALVSEWQEHGTIAQYLKKNPDVSPIKFIEDSLVGLEYIHSLRLVHADIKVANILIDGTPKARLSDFGTAFVIANTAGATSQGNKGTVIYLAPELLDYDFEKEDQGVATIASDVYAVAICLWEIFNGGPPYTRWKGYGLGTKVVNGLRPEGRPEHPDLRDDIWDIIQRAWANEVDKRPSVGQILEIVRKDGRLV